jgi:hypothetical protein
MTDLAAAATPMVAATTPLRRTVGGNWLVALTAACAFGALGFTRNPTLFVTMVTIAIGSLLMARAASAVDARTRRSLTLLQTLGLVCCLTVLLGLPH